MSKIIVLAVLAYGVLSCLNPTQLQGNCSECEATQQLVQGFCYERIRGCLEYNVGGNCATCQSGYVKIGIECVRTAIAQGNFNLTPAPSRPSIVGQLSIQDIQNRLDSNIFPFYSQINVFFIGGYPGRIGFGKVQNVRTLESATGVYLVITYIADRDSNIKYQAVGFKQYETGEVTQILFSQVQGGSKDPIRIIDRIITQNPSVSELSGWQLLEIINNQTHYMMEFINEENRQYISFQVNVPDLSSNPQTYQIIKKQKQFSVLTLRKILQKYPEFLQQKYTVKRLQGFFIFDFDEKSVSVQFKNGIFIINKPVLLTGSNAGVDSSQFIKVGSWKQSNQYADPITNQVVALAKQRFPQVFQAELVKLRTQIVAGQNFELTFRILLGKHYTIVVYRDLRGNLSVTKTQQVEAQNVYDSNYNYNNDQLFFQLYDNIRVQTSIFNFQPITSVQKIQYQNLIRYWVNFEDFSYISFAHNTDTKKSQLLLFSLGGQLNFRDQINIVTKVEVQPTTGTNTNTTTEPVSLGSRNPTTRSQNSTSTTNASSNITVTITIQNQTNTVSENTTTNTTPTSSTKNIDTIGLPAIAISEPDEKQLIDHLRSLYPGLVNGFSVFVKKSGPIASDQKWKIVLHSGTYELQVSKVNNIISTKNFIKLSTESCHQLEIDTSYELIKDFDVYFRQRYDLTYHQLQSLKVSVDKTVHQLIFTYTDQIKQPREITLQISRDNRYEVVSNKVLQQQEFKSLSSSTSVSDNLLYQRALNAVRVLHYSWSFINPVYMEHNVSVVRAYIGNDSEVVRVTLSKATFIVSQRKVITSDNLNGVPKEIIFSYMIYPEVIGNGFFGFDRDLMKNIMILVPKVFPKEAVNPKLLFASKITYNLYRSLIKVDEGYLQYDASVNIYGVVEFSNIFKYTEAAFPKLPNCSQYDLIGNCKSCSANQQSFEGSCYDKIQSCQIQAGSICLKCKTGSKNQKYQCTSGCGDII